MKGNYYYFSDTPMSPIRNISFSSMAFLVALFSLSQGAVAQYKDSAGIMVPVLGPNDTIPVPAMVLQRELIPGGNMEWFWVSAPYPKHLLRKRQEWTRLRNAIYVTYPYARRGGTDHE